MAYKFLVDSPHQGRPKNKALSVNLNLDKRVALRIGCAPKTAMPAVRQVEFGPFSLTIYSSPQEN